MKLQKGKRYDEAVQIEFPPFRIMVFAEAGRITENQVRDEIVRRVNAYDALLNLAKSYRLFAAKSLGEEMCEEIDRIIIEASETRTEEGSAIQVNAALALAEKGETSQ